METPRTDQESKMTPREGVAVVEAAFAASLEKELNKMALAISDMLRDGSEISQSTYDEAERLIINHTHARLQAMR